MVNWQAHGRKLSRPNSIYFPGFSCSNSVKITKRLRDKRWTRRVSRRDLQNVSQQRYRWASLTGGTSTRRPAAAQCSPRCVDVDIVVKPSAAEHVVSCSQLTDLHLQFIQLNWPHTSTVHLRIAQQSSLFAASAYTIKARCTQRSCAVPHYCWLGVLCEVIDNMRPHQSVRGPVTASARFAYVKFGIGWLCSFGRRSDGRTWGCKWISAPTFRISWRFTWSLVWTIWRQWQCVNESFVNKRSSEGGALLGGKR
jgi:hypothetical protein